MHGAISRIQARELGSCQGDLIDQLMRQLSTPFAVVSAIFPRLIQDCRAYCAICSFSYKLSILRGSLGSMQFEFKCPLLHKGVGRGGGGA